MNALSTKASVGHGSQARARRGARRVPQPKLTAPRIVSRRDFLGNGVKAAALAAAAGPILAACGSSGSSAGSSGDDVLTIGLPVFPKSFKATEKFLTTFEKSTGVTVNLFTTNTASNTWVSVFQEISTRLAGGEPIDSANIATEGMLLFAKRGVLEPLDSYIAGDKALVDSFYSDVNAPMLANFRQLDNLNGKTYFIPYVYNTMSIWYNRALFKQHKLPDPAPGWTWDDFEKAATTIASSPGTLGYAIGTPVPGPFTDVYPWVLTNGGQILNASQSQCVANNPAAIEAASFVRSLVTKKVVNQPGGSYDQFSAIAANKLGMFGGGAWPNGDIPLTQAEINKQLAIAPWPRKASNGTPVGLAAFPMFKSTRNKKALWEFIKFTVSAEFQGTHVVPFSGGMPIRQSAGATQAALLPPGSDYFNDELSYSTMIVGVPNGSAVENEISTAWEQILTGSTTPAAGMAAMESTCNQLMAQKV
jgi:multiple sugar transport system substrate-binding protein